MDEREIEAVAEVLAWEFGISERPSQRIIDASAKAVAALDRVRVARGDDVHELAWREAQNELDRLRAALAARSPQDEDHEAER